MSVVFSAPGKDGAMNGGPKLILKYIVAQSGDYICALSGQRKHLPWGYAPAKESLWTPAKSGKSNHWIDPAFGEDLNREAPFILCYDPGDRGTEEDGIEVYRCVEPPSNVNDLFCILKAYTHGLFEMKCPSTLKEVWTNITAAIKRSEKIEKMMWKKLPDAKFGFKIRNIFKMDTWRNKSTFRLASVDSLLGITQAQLTSEFSAIGYDLAKVPGYDPKLILQGPGWQVVKHFVLQMMDAAEFRKLHTKLESAGKLMTKNRMKMLKNAAEGWEI